LGSTVYLFDLLQIIKITGLYYPHEAFNWNQELNLMVSVDYINLSVPEPSQMEQLLQGFVFTIHSCFPYFALVIHLHHFHVSFGPK